MKKLHLFLLIALLPIISTLSAQDTWIRRADFTGNARRGATGFNIASKGYIVAGFDGAYYNDLWEYDPTTNTWTQKADLPAAPRMGGVAFSNTQNAWFGTGYDGTFMADMWRYEPGTNAWAAMADFGGGARQGSISLTIGADFFVGMGYTGAFQNDLYKYNTLTDTWTAVTPLPAGGRIYAAAFSTSTTGYVGLGFGTGYLSDLWAYNPTLGNWIRKADFGGTARALSTSYSIGNRGYLAAGDDGTNLQSEMWEYNPVNDAWSKLNSFRAVGRELPAGFVVDGKAYLMGGSDNGSTYFNDFWQWNSNYCDLTANALIQHAACPGDANGAIDLTISGIHTPYTVNWSTGNNTEDLTGVVAGDYRYTITDTVNCMLKGILKIDDGIAIHFGRDTSYWGLSKKAGGPGDDNITSILTDPTDGAITVTGTFKSSAIFNSTTLNSFGGTDAFIARYNAGGVLLWVRQIGGTIDDQATSLGADSLGNLYLTGRIGDMAFFGTQQVNTAGEYDIFLARYTKTGNLVWVRTAGGSLTDQPRAMYTDRSGNCYITGSFQGLANFQGENLMSLGGNDIFTAKFNNSGVMQWVKQAGSVTTETGTGIGTDMSGNVLVTGIFQSSLTIGSTTLTSSGANDIFLTKYSRYGEPVWAVQAGGTQDDQSYSIHINPAGQTIIAGSFIGTAQFGLNSITSAGAGDIFVAAFNADGTNAWATRAGGLGDDAALALSPWINGDYMIGGRFSQTATIGAKQFQSAGGNDLFLARIDALGVIRFAIANGGQGDDAAFALTTGTTGKVYIGGNYSQNIGFGTNILLGSGGTDAFFATLSFDDLYIAPVVTNVNCPGGSDGTISYEVAGGRAPYTFQWDNGSTTQNLTGLVVGNYQLTITDANGCTKDTTFTIISESLPPTAPTAATTDRENFCENDNGNILLTAIGGTGEIVKWYTDGCGTTPVGEDEILSLASPDTTTTYYARWENVCGITSCAEVTVHVRNLPETPISVMAIPATVCAGAESVTLTATGGSGDIFRWYKNSCGGILEGEGSTFVVPSLTTNTTFYGRYESYCGITPCLPVSVTVLPQPVKVTSVTASVSEICFNYSSTITLTAIGGSGTQLTWTKGSCGGTFIGNINPLPIDPPTVTTTYYAYWQNSCGSSLCDSVTIIVKPGPVPPATASVNVPTYCNGSMNTITLSTTGGSGDVLKWYKGYCGGEYVGSDTTLTITAPTVSTTYFARWENSCDNSTCMNVPVTVNPKPVVTLTGLAPYYCEDNSSSILLQGSPANTGTFVIIPGLTDNLNGTATYVPSLASQGTNIVIYNFTDPNGCSGTAFQTTEIKPLPIVFFTGLGAEYCANEPEVDLTGSEAPNGYFSPVTGLSSIINGTAKFSPAVAGPGTHNITYNYIDSYGCFNDSTKSVLVNALPVVSFTGLPANVCQNDQPYTLVGQPTGGYFAGIGITNTIPGEAAFNPAAAGVGGPYSIAYIYTDANGCTNAFTALVIVNELPEVGFSGLASSYCANVQSVLLIGDQAPNGTFSGQNIHNNGNGTAYFYPVQVGAGTYDITYKVTSLGGCSDSITQTVTVLSLPVISFSGLNASYCRNNDPVTLVGSESPFGSFTGPGITDLFNGTAFFNPAIPTGTGPHDIIYSFTDLAGCSNTDTMQVIINELTPVSFTGLGSSICANETANLTGSQAPAGTFSGNPGVTDLGSGTGTFDASITGLGTFEVIYTFLDANGCESADTVQVTVQPIPEPTIIGMPETYCLDALADTIEGSGYPFGEFTTPSNGLTDLGIGMAIFNPAVAGIGIHEITYTLTDFFGCTGDTTYSVEVIAPPVVTLTGLDTAYCVDAQAVTITGSPSLPGGIFTGIGISDNGNGTATFDPAAAGSGGPYAITYIYTNADGCTNDTTLYTVVNPLPVAPAHLFTNHNLYCSGQFTQIELSAPITTTDSVRWYTGSCTGTYLGSTTLNNVLTIEAPADSTWLYAHAVNGCGETACDSLLIEVIPLPIAPDSVYSDTTGYCYGSIQTINLNATGGYGDVLSWHLGSCDGIQLGTGNQLPIASPTDTTWYFAKWTSICGVSECDSVRVDVTPMPITPDSLSVDTSNYCIGTVTQIVLTAFGGLGDTVQWYTKSCGDSLVGTGNPLTITAPDTNETYYARWKNQCMVSYCTSIDVIVKQLPETPDSLFADHNDFCDAEFGVINLNATGGSGELVRWFEGSCTGTELGVGNPLLITAPIDTTTYYARWESSCGESECKEFTVNVKPLPAPIASISISPGIVCPEDVVDITLSATGTFNQGDTIYWYANSVGGIAVGKGNPLTIANPNVTTIYFAVNTNTCGESVALTDTLIVDAPLPPTSMIPDTNYLCKGFSTTINIAASGGNGTTLTWYGTSCGGTVLGTGTQLSVTAPDTTTWYYATYTNSCGESDCDSVAIHIIPNAVAPDTIFPNINDICIGSVEFITLTSEGGYGDTISPHGESLTWFLRECGGLVVGTGKVISIPAPIVTTKYLARWENSCSISECKELTLVVNTPKPPDTISVDTNYFCPGAVSAITLSGTGGNGTATKWAIIQGADTIIIGSGTHLTVVAPLVTTRYLVRKENYCGLSPWAFIDVVVNLPVSPVMISATDDSICALSGMSVMMWAEGGVGDSLLWWSEFDPTIIISDTLTVSPGTTTTYFARYKTNCGVSDPVSYTLTVIPKPIAVINKELDSICEQLSYPVSVDTLQNNATIEWTTTGSGWFDNPNAASTVYHYGNYDVITSDTVMLIFTAYGNTPCADAADTTTLIINPKPEFSLYPDDPAICRDSSILITVTGEPTFSYHWEPETGLDTIAGDSVVASPRETTSYEVIATTLQGCSDMIPFGITVHPKPYLNLGVDQYLFTCEPVKLDAGGGDGFEYYLWDNQSQSRIRTISETGHYWVTVGNEGCTVTDSIYIQLCEGVFNVPTAFSPNSDGVNEVFRPVTSDVTISFKMYIYDRHGMLIYQTDDLQKGWDGKFNGDVCPAGIYIYYLVFRGDGTTAPGREQTLSGQVFLVR
ncbi:MAG TPA: hypothetical protein DEO70_12795 [Bacteroidales bacterium]|nr:MAG: hypothetical protein A2X11_07675 [Bacteroidetes bacterium GWE2_42_24]OFY26483.1 MAG: hypothetical protein A2X09_02280 [Bacteroidetes bacterium GWF2_43_11]HBZ67706.1 hypothetical protein [Bacteroidales bacterium]